MTEVLACAQQPLLTYLLEVLIVDDAPSHRKEPFFLFERCVMKKINGRCHLNFILNLQLQQLIDSIHLQKT